MIDKGLHSTAQHSKTLLTFNTKRTANQNTKRDTIQKCDFFAKYMTDAGAENARIKYLSRESRECVEGVALDVLEGVLQDLRTQ